MAASTELACVPSAEPRPVLGVRRPVEMQRPVTEAPLAVAKVQRPIAEVQRPVADVPPLEPHFHYPPLPRCRRGLDKYEAALQIDARLALRAKLRTRLERARAAVARALLDSRASEQAGYSNPRDYAREELGLSLRALQESAQLDRLLNAFPSFDAAISSGEMTASRVLEVAPVLTPETERGWFKLAKKHTAYRLRQIVAAVKAQSAQRLVSRDPGAGSSTAGAPSLLLPPEEKDAVLKQQAPMRSKLLWEAFLEESARVSGRPISQGKALEILLAEFWPLVPSSVAEKVRSRSRGSAGVVVNADEDDGEEWVLEEFADETAGPAADECGGSTPLDAPANDSQADREDDPFRIKDAETLRWQTFDPMKYGLAGWRRELMEAQERDPSRRAEVKDLDRRALKYVDTLIAKGIPVGLPHEDEVLLDTTNLKGLGPVGLERRYFAIRKRLRRLAVDEGALFYVMRGFRLYRALRYASFGHYTRDRFGLSRRTAEEHADTHQMLFYEPALEWAWMRDGLSDSHLALFRRLIRSGIRGKALEPWVRRALEVPVATFRDQVRYIEAARNGWWAARTGDRSLYPYDPPSREDWVPIRSELNRRPDFLLWVAHGAEFAGPAKVGAKAESAKRADIRADGAAKEESARGGSRAPDAEVAKAAEFRAESAEEHADIRARNESSGDSGPDPASLNPLIPSPAEPATCNLRLYGPPDVLESYLDAIEAVRAIYGPDRPAWWCLEVMILHVRRDWAAENAHARRNTKHYDVYERDGFRCTTPGCTSRGELHAHHLDPAARGGSDDLYNLTTLCAACHLYALHREGLIRAYGRAPDQITWELGIETGPDGKTRPRRVFLGEFRVDLAEQGVDGGSTASPPQRATFRTSHQHPKATSRAASDTRADTNSSRSSGSLRPRRSRSAHWQRLQARGRKRGAR